MKWKAKEDELKFNNKQDFERFIKSQNNFINTGKSPYEAKQNYKVLRNFFNVEMKERQVNICKNLQELKWIPVKTNSQPIEIKSYNRFDKDNIFNIYPYPFLNTSKSKEDLNADLPMEGEGQIDGRIKTSSANFRNNSPQVFYEGEFLQRVGTSPTGLATQGRTDRHC